MNRKGNIYDRIFKENAEQLFIPLIALKLDIKIKSFQPLQEKIPETLEREVDFLYRIETEDDNQSLLHLEFQTEDDKQMIYRMSEYHGLIYKKYQLPIIHIVIFLGARKPKMRTKLKSEEIFSGFELISIHELNTTQLLSSQIPEVILLTLLSDYEKERTEAILRLIVQQLKKTAATPEKLSKYLTQLVLLSRLRRLESLTKKVISEMPIYYDITQDDLYKEGLETGIQQERKRAEQERKRAEQDRKRAEQDRKKAEQDRKRAEQDRKRAERERRNTVIALLQLGILTDEQIAKITNITMEKLNSIKQNLD